MNNEYKNLIEDMRCFVRKQRVKAGFVSGVRLHGYTFSELEERIEKIPCCDWFKIMRQISTNEEINEWYIDFVFKFNRIKQKELF